MLEVLTPVTPLTLSGLVGFSNHTRSSATEKQDMSTAPCGKSLEHGLWRKKINITHVCVCVSLCEYTQVNLCVFVTILVSLNVINSFYMQAWTLFIHVMSSTATLREPENKQGTSQLCDWSVLVGEHCCSLLRAAKKNFSHHIYWIWSLNYCGALYNLQLW